MSAVLGPAFESAAARSLSSPRPVVRRFLKLRKQTKRRRVIWGTEAT